MEGLSRRPGPGWERTAGADRRDVSGFSWAVHTDFLALLPPLSGSIKIRAHGRASHLGLRSMQVSKVQGASLLGCPREKKRGEREGGTL